MRRINNLNRKKYNALKEQALNYYEENKVTMKMETVLNKMFLDKPSDVHGYLVNYFGQFCKPATLNQLTAKPVLDSCGLLTIQTDVYCTVNNLKKYISSTTISRANIKINTEDQEQTEKLINRSVKAGITLINSELSNKVDGLDPSAQEKIDSEILTVVNLQNKLDVAMHPNYDRRPTAVPTDRKGTQEDDRKKNNPPKVKNDKPNVGLPMMADRPLETFPEGCEAAAAVSQAVCVCAAASKNIPVYQHIAHLAQQNVSENNLSMPIPMVTILESGKSTSGKVICVKEFMLVPEINMPTDKSVEYIQHIFHYISKQMVTKHGVLGRLVNESGALCPPLENVNQGLDLLLEAVKAVGLTIGEDMYLAINCAGPEFYDHEKGKYETLTGQFKSPDDMVDFWADILQKYPCIVAVIDPLRREDSEQWMRLCEKVSNQVLVIGDMFFQRPGIICHLEFPVQTSGIVIHVERMNTISDIISCANKYKGCNNELVISANQTETNDTFIVDLAVGLNARFLKVGGLCRGERTCKLNRLVQICEEISLHMQSVAPELKKEEAHSNADDLENIQQDIDSLYTEQEAPGAKQVHHTSSAGKEEQRTHVKSHISFTFPFIKNIEIEPETEEQSVEAH